MHAKCYMPREREYLFLPAFLFFIKKVTMLYEHQTIWKSLKRRIGDAATVDIAYGAMTMASNAMRMYSPYLIFSTLVYCFLGISLQFNLPV